MGKFDTHGGYYAPKNYFRINEGGSHSENPNGGVQIGVDQNGVPNLLEENEPVFKDFVFSDNIKANKSMLKEMVLPEKYAGKLYSEIADILIEEAEERPMDPISNNGLNAMLGRLADAQEEQKMRKEEKELQAMISQLSPEELAMLSSAVQQPQQIEPQPQMMQPQMRAPQQMFPQEQYIPQDMMMTNGGNLYAEGSPLTPEEERILLSGLSDSDKAYYAEHGYLRPVMLEGPDIGGKGVLPGMKRALKAGSTAKKLGKFAKELVMSSVDPTYGWRNWNSSSKGLVGKGLTTIGKAVQSALAVNTDSLYPVRALTGNNFGISGLIHEGSSGATKHARSEDELTTFEGFACGGKIGNKYPLGGPYAIGYMWDPQLETPSAFPAGVGPLLDPVTNSTVSGTPTVSGISTGSRITTLPYDNSNGFAYFNNGQYDKGYLDWLNKTAFASTDSPLWNTLSDYYKTTTGKTLTPQTAISLGKDKKFGKFHNLLGSGYSDYLRKTSMGEALPQLDALTGRAVQASELPPTLVQSQIDAETNAINDSIDAMYAADPSIYGMPPAEQLSNSGIQSSDETLYPTALRYAGVLGNLIGTINNIAQKPDRYQYRPITAKMQTTDIPLQMQQYIPLDMSLPVGSINAQSGATARAIMNSGAGPATGAMLLSNGFNTNNALGNAYMQGVQYNNQQRNTAIAANNAALSQRAAFRQREAEELAQLQQRADMQNMQSALQIQMLNNQAQQAKASAAGTTLENLLNGLAGIGNENFSFNMLRKFPYTIDKEGNIIYNRG